MVNLSGKDGSIIIVIPSILILSAAIFIQGFSTSGIRLLQTMVVSLGSTSDSGEKLEEILSSPTVLLPTAETPLYFPLSSYPSYSNVKGVLVTVNIALGTIKISLGLDDAAI